jgi:hypothetical protein
MKNFILGDRVAYRKEKKCKKQSKFRAHYTRPYIIYKIDEKMHKLELRSAREGLETIASRFQPLMWCIVRWTLISRRSI